MSHAAAVLELVPLAALKPHERVVPSKVRALVSEIRRTGVFEDPIWVARGTWVILNGHHRTAALRRLGAERVPAWVIDYHDDAVRLDRWTPGPPISKEEVVRRANDGDPFPPRTTRHTIAADLPPRPTLLAELIGPNRPTRDASHARRAGASRSAPSAGSVPPE
ncbi:MAG TPA: ParB N-terminal domain-containing protein [Thermoplasmata archaeon]|nr:ParB N-terminal domain-containing protein [Thermoplasmata archaeon]